MSDLRTNHAGVVSPMSSTHSYHNDGQHYDATATHESGLKATRRKYIMSYFVRYIDNDNDIDQQNTHTLFFCISVASWCFTCFCIVMCVCLCTGHFVMELLYLI